MDRTTADWGVAGQRLSVPSVAAAQAGVFTRVQAMEEGFSRNQVARRVHNGEWVQVAGRGLASRFLRLSINQGAWSMALTWPDAILWGPSAVMLLAPEAPLTRNGSMICVVPTHRRAQAHLTPRTSQLSTSEITSWGGVRVQCLEAALVDGLMFIERTAADSLFAWIVSRRALSLDQARTLLVPRRGHPGAGRLAFYLTLLESGAASAAELSTHCLLRQHGITGWVAPGTVVLPGGLVLGVDILFAELRLVLEIDGRRFHQGADAFETDRARDNALHAAGYQTMRLTWKMIADTPDRVIAELQAIMARQRRILHPKG